MERADELRASLDYISVGETNPLAHVWHARQLPYSQLKPYVLGGGNRTLSPLHGSQADTDCPKKA
jgi:hypothetical protein